jgi:nucleotide-binding universal stress UspA family protein
MSATANSSAATGHIARLAPFTRALVATDASLAADGAMRVGAALADRDRTNVSVISVVEPKAYPAPVHDLTVATHELPSHDDLLIAERRRHLDAQCERLSMPLPDDLLVECSVPLSGILFQATLRKSELIVLGLGRHTTVDRLFGSETALHAVREADVATLAVPAMAARIPHRAVVGMDFDASSVAAARAAARLVGPFGSLTLVHVDPLADPLPAMLADWPPHVVDRLNDAFARVLGVLALPDTMQIEMVPLAGHVAKELTGYAEKIGADVIAVGRHSRSLMERVVLGSSTTRVIRTATCAVLVVPRDS